MPKKPHVAEDPFCECERCKRKNALMRKVFLQSEEGRKALGYLLEDLGFFRAESSDADRILGNFAKTMLWRIGIYKDLTSLNWVHAMGNILPKG